MGKGGGMRRQYKKYAAWGAGFAVLITLGAATAAFTAGAAPFGAQATKTTATTETTGGSTVVTTITTTTPDSSSSSTDSSSTDTSSTDTSSTDTTSTTDSGGGGNAPAATPKSAELKFTG